MSEEFKVTLPKLGESILSATIVQWFKKVGDSVKLDEPLLEVSTDKVNSEIPSPVAGVVKEILVFPDVELRVGDPMVIIDTSVDSVIASTSSSTTPDSTPPTLAHEQKTDTASMRDLFSPAVLRLAREHGIELKELEKIPGTGEGGRISKKDIEDYLACGKTSSCAARTSMKTEPTFVQAPSADSPRGQEGVERLKMSGLRKAIADNMVRSFYEAPHATLIHEVDVTDILHYIQKEKENFLAQHGAKLTVTSFVARALVRALKEYPLINSSLEQDTIVMKKFVNLGIAVSVENGVVVPVIKNCQKLDLPGIAQEIQSLSTKVRTNKLSQQDVTEGTITLTNFGMSGVAIGIPIIRHPEVAILGIGAAHKKVVVMEGDVMAIRSIINICFTFDHRVLDGMYGCAFLGALKHHLEKI